MIYAKRFMLNVFMLNGFTTHVLQLTIKHLTLKFNLLEKRYSRNLQ